MGMDDLDRAYGVSNQNVSNNKFQALDAAYGISEAETPKEESLGDTALQFGRGVIASGPGQTIDLLQGKSIPAMYGDISPENFRGSPELVAKMSGKQPQEISDIYKKADEQSFPELHAEKNLTGLYDKLAGKDLQPSTTRGKIAETAGQFLSPDIITKPIKFGKMLYKGTDKLLKHFGKDFLKSGAQALGASSAVHAPAHLTEEGGAGRIAEDLGRSIAGGIAGTASLNPIQSLKSVGKGIKSVGEKTAAKIMSLGTHPEKEVLSLAKKHNIELPHNIGTGKGSGSSVQNFLANNYLSKSPFSSGKYKKSYQKADDAMMGKLREALGDVGETTLKPSEASSQFKHHAKSEEAKVQKIASKLYDDSASRLTELDKIAPKHTEQAIIDIEKKINKPIRSSADKEVAKHLASLAEDWKITKDGKKVGIFEPGDLNKWENEQYTRKNLREMFGKLKSGANEIPAEEFVKAIQGINGVLGTRDAVGVTNFLNGLKGAITKDLNTLPNKNFLDSYKKANQYFSKNVWNRFRTKTARGLLKDDGAVEAYGLLNSVDGVNRLEKMAGKSEQGLQNLNALKRLKAEEMFEKAIEGSLENGTLRKAAFSKMFEKNAKNQEVLEKLIGKTQYENLSDIAKISESFSSHGKDLLNTSHTGITLHNLTQASAVTGTALQFIFGHVPPAQMMAAAGVVVVPQVMSRIMSNPNIIRQSRIYALARQKGNEKYAAAIMRNLVKMIEKEQKPILQTIAKNAKEGDDNE